MDVYKNTHLIFMVIPDNIYLCCFNLSCCIRRTTFFIKGLLYKEPDISVSITSQDHMIRLTTEMNHEYIGGVDHI